MYVQDFGVRPKLPGQIAGSLHQVCFAQTDTPVKKQRVIGLPRVFSDLAGSRPGELVGFTLDVGLKCKRRVETAFKTQST